MLPAVDVTGSAKPVTSAGIGPELWSRMVVWTDELVVDFLGVTFQRERGQSSG